MKTIPYTINRNFYGVCNALFCKETVRYNDICKTIIYDCGTCGKSSIDKVVREAVKGQERIDLLFISHYDIDHVRCLQKLLREIYVGKLILPLISYDNKFYSLYSHMDTEEDDSIYWDFTIDPQWAVRTWNIQNTSIKIEYVRNSQFDEEKVPSFNTLSMFYQSSPFDSSDHEDGDWKYIPFNPYPFSVEQENKFFTKLRAETGIADLNRNSIKDKWKEYDLRKAVKDTSVTLFKEEEVKINDSSMTLYSGPTSEHYKNYKLGCLYTGDYNAKHNLQALKEFYGIKNGCYSHIGMVQIPHHGSEHNFNKQLVCKDIIPVIPVSLNTEAIAGLEETEKAIKEVSTYFITDDKGVFFKYVTCLSLFWNSFCKRHDNEKSNFFIMKGCEGSKYLILYKGVLKKKENEISSQCNH